MRDSAVAEAVGERGIMLRISKKRGRIALEITAVPMGPDICVTIIGGAGHIGAVTAVSPQTDARTTAFGTHKEFRVTEMVAARLKARLNCTAAAVCGIHFDDITKEEIADVLALSAELTDALCEILIHNNGGAE